MPSRGRDNCECSEDYGPCEQHGDTLVSRDGAAVRTADELALLQVADFLGLGVTLDVDDKAEYDRLTTKLETSRNATSGTAWFDDPFDAENARELAGRVASDAAGDLWLIADDGYGIVRVHPDCPLLQR